MLGSTEITFLIEYIWIYSKTIVFGIHIHLIHMNIICFAFPFTFRDFPKLLLFYASECLFTQLFHLIHDCQWFVYSWMHFHIHSIVIDLNDSFVLLLFEYSFWVRSYLIKFSAYVCPLFHSFGIYSLIHSMIHCVFAFVCQTTNFFDASNGALSSLPFGRTSLTPPEMP